VKSVATVQVGDLDISLEGGFELIRRDGDWKTTVNHAEAKDV
jgi:hypothetical protein